MKNGKRVSSATEFLNLASTRSNLRVGVMVEKNKSQHLFLQEKKSFLVLVHL
jgi:hypothetical protein